MVGCTVPNAAHSTVPITKVTGVYCSETIETINNDVSYVINKDNTETLLLDGTYTVPQCFYGWGCLSPCTFKIINGIPYT